MVQGSSKVSENSLPCFSMKSRWIFYEYCEHAHRKCDVWHCLAIQMQQTPNQCSIGSICLSFSPRLIEIRILQSIVDFVTIGVSQFAACAISNRFRMRRQYAPWFNTIWSLARSNLIPRKYRSCPNSSNLNLWRSRFFVFSTMLFWAHNDLFINVHDENDLLIPISVHKHPFRGILFSESEFHQYRTQQFIPQSWGLF